MQTTTIQQILDSSKTLNVVCVGDVMVDRYVMGAVSRVSPEAPIPVLQQTHTRSTLGAAGNVARNIAHLGVNVTLIGVVGDDNVAHEATRLVSEEHKIIGELITARGRKTTVKTRYLAGTQQLLRVDQEDKSPLMAQIEAHLMDAIVAECSDADLILVSDYAKGALTDDILSKIAEVAARRNIPVLVDPKGTDYKRYGKVSLIKPNARELFDLTQMPTQTDDEVHAALIAAKGMCDADTILVTRGGRGMAFLDDKDDLQMIKAQTREIYDVSGAGDTVLATLGLAMASGLPLSDATAFAVLASGLVVEKVGAAAVGPTELLKAAEGQKSHDQKIMALPVLEEQVVRWRARGLRVGFTNGCFDLLHPGHLKLISAAKATCDRLIVAINTDDSVKRLKGASRPIQPETSRAHILAALADVDAVCMFADDTPLQTLEVLMPDVLVKGADYTIDQVVGADIIQANGGTVKLVELQDGFSTTSAIDKIQENV